MNLGIESFTERADSRSFTEELKAFATSISVSPCDKCGHLVPPQNSAVIFDYINALGTNWTLYFATNRHLQPVTEANGVVICEGSPSRWQNVRGVKDSRPEYTLRGEQPELGYAIWEMMQTLANSELE